MITAQDIRDVKFSKSLGGYKTAEVDEFLDECAAALETLTAANEENSRKMQVLAESIVEYRDREDSIRTALLSAQRMSETVINEANEKAEQIVAKAHEEAELVLENANREYSAELDELQRIRSEVAAFKARLMATYREHLTLIGVLEGDEDPTDTAPAKQEVDAAPVAAEESTTVPEDAAEESTSDADVKLDLSSFELKDEE